MFQGQISVEDKIQRQVIVGDALLYQAILVFTGDDIPSYVKGRLSDILGRIGKGAWQKLKHMDAQIQMWGPGTRPQGYKTFFMLNSAEHKIYLAHKC